MVYYLVLKGMLMFFVFLINDLKIYIIRVYMSVVEYLIKMGVDVNFCDGLKMFLIVVCE